MNRRRKGFTLVELLVVMGIIAALAMIGGAAYISAQKRGRNARRLADIQQIRTALEMYRTDNGYYPKEAAALCDSSVGSDAAICPPTTLGSWDTTNGVAKELSSGYINSMPNDPLNNGSYYFNYQSKPDTCDNDPTSTDKCVKYELTYRDEGMSGPTPTQATVYNP
jgi:general secretion pathway protein G